MGFKKNKRGFLKTMEKSKEAIKNEMRERKR
jgi:hypothetical protein